MGSVSESSSDKNAVHQAIPSKSMTPIQGSFLPVFIQNQFRTTIPLPTKEEYSNVNGKCAIVTGSNTGLGLEASRQLLSLGLSHLILGVRSLEKGNQAATELRTVNASATIEVWELDMESYQSVQKFAQRCQDNLKRIDIVILNAGISPTKFAIVSSTGHERTMQVNHMSTALLAVLLLPILKRKSKGSEPSRLTIVNSVMAHLCKFPNRSQRPLLPSFDDTNITPWDPQERYGVSKLMSQLFFVKLADIMDSNDVIINMVDPGLTKGTSLSRDTRGFIWVAATLFISAAGRPVANGAATYIDAVSGQDNESHGCFLMNCKISPLACWYYTEGQSLSDLVWSETLQELDFAGVKQILESLSKSTAQ